MVAQNSANFILTAGRTINWEMKALPLWPEIAKTYRNLL
jgi:hypothetical protein